MLIAALCVLTLAAALAVWRTRLAIGFQLAFLIRFQLVLVLTPVTITILSWVASGMFGNLVILQNNIQAFWVAAVGFSCAWFALALTIIVLDHAGERFRVGRFFRPDPAQLEHFERFRAPRWFWEWSFVLFTVPPLVLMVRVYSASGSVYLGLVVGFIAAYLPALLLDSLAHFLDRSQITARRFIFMSSSYYGRFGAFLAQADPLRNIRVPWLSYFGPGYVDEEGHPHPDFIVASVAFLLAAALYIGSFWWGWYWLQHGRADAWVPALSYLEFLILSVSLILAGAAFYLDRYRVPVIVAVTVYSIVCSKVADTNHYWRAASKPQPKVSAVTSPEGQVAGTESRISIPYSDGLKEWLGKYNQSRKSFLQINEKPVAIVVCASGGGIEAAGWTAKVLTGLQDELGNDGPRFTGSIRLISSTSGGSVGSLFFVQSFFWAQGPPPRNQLDPIYRAAIHGSLDATGWGFVHPDFARLFVPWMLIAFPMGSGGVRYVDRGWALEQAWRIALEDPRKKDEYIQSNLSDWRELVNKGMLPGTVFNATLVESGNPLLLSTIHLPLFGRDNPGGQAETDQARAFVFGQTEKDFGADISTVTAARLSATFPYVSPVAKGVYNECAACGLPAGGAHVADGGYYDNYGVTVAVQWVDDVVQRYVRGQSPPQLGKIIIVLINAFPEGKQEAPALNPRGGWSSEILGPAKTFLNARTATQLGRDDIGLALLKSLNRILPNSSNPACPDFITTVWFTAAHNGPLSWQLSPDEEHKIDSDWKSKANQEQIEKLKRCLQLK